MKKQEFLKKHSFTDLDFRNLQRYEDTRKSGVFNMFEYLGLMRDHNLNGGKRLADWIQSVANYEEFIEVLENERNK